MHPKEGIAQPGGPLCDRNFDYRAIGKFRGCGLWSRAAWNVQLEVLARRGGSDSNGDVYLPGQSTLAVPVSERATTA